MAKSVPALLRSHGLRPRKRLGQNFLVDPWALERIVAAADFSSVPFGLANKIPDNEITYEELQSKYLDRYEMHWKSTWIEPSSFRDKIKVSGKLQLIPLDGTRCTLIREGSVHIKIFGVGRLLESLAAEQVGNISKKFSDVVTKWKAKNAIHSGS